MVVNMPVRKMLLCLMYVKIFDLILIVISKFKIGAIK